MRRQKPIVSADLGALASPPADTAIVVPAATTPQVVSTVLPVADTPAVTVPPQVIS
ncbi:hypothetical protein H7Y63_00400 [Polaromonas sp.]|nr:hypothetical protein [Candidatus Saccharibacteria bacterium]